MRDYDEPSDPIQSDLRVLDGFNPNDPLMDYLLLLWSCRGAYHAWPGQPGCRCKSASSAQPARPPRPRLLSELRRVSEPGRDAEGVAQEERPTNSHGHRGAGAEDFRGSPGVQGKKAADTGPAAISPKFEALLPALEGKAMVLFAAHRADDIATALRIADEFHLKPVIALGTEAFLLTDELAKGEVPVIVHPTMQRAAGSMETANTLLANAALLHNAKVPITIGTAFEGYVPKTRNLRGGSCGGGERPGSGAGAQGHHH